MSDVHSIGRIRLAAVMLVIVALVVAALRLLAVDSVADSPNPIEPEPARAWQQPDASTDRESDIERDAARRSESIRIKTVSGGEPVSGAVLASAPVESRLRRSIATSIEQRLGRSDQAGVVECSWVDVRGRVLTARAGGYQVASLNVGHDRPPGSLIIQLDRGSRLSVSCRSRDGRPISGVELGLSLSAMPDARAPVDDFAQLRPFGSRATAIHTATTTEAGNAEFVMLPALPHYIQVHHPGYAMVAGLEASQQVAVGQGDNLLQLTFDPLLLSLATVVDAKVISWSAHPPSGVSINSRVAEQASWINAWWSARVGSRVLCLTCVPVWRDGAYQELEQPATFDVLTEAKGVSSVLVPVRPALEWSSPHSVLLGEPSERVAAATIDFVLRDPDSQLHDWMSGISLQQIREDRRMFFIPLADHVGTGVRVPLGNYRLTTHQPLLKQHVSGLSVSVVGDERFEIDVPMAVRRCRVRWVGPAGVIADDGSVEWEWRKRRYAHVMSRGLSEYPWVLPVGEIGYRIESRVGSARGLLEIPEGSGMLDLRCQVTPE